MKLIKQLLEQRREDLSYKEEKTKGIVTKVIVELSGNESGEASKLAKRYKQLLAGLSILEKKKAELNEKLTEKALSLFDDAADTLCMRVVSTASFTISVSKQQEPKEKQEVDYEALFKAVSELVSEELQPKLQELIDLNTKKWTEKPKKPSLSVNKIEEGVVTAAVNKVTDFFQKLEEQLKALYKSFKSWGKSYDMKLAELKKSI